MENGLCDDFYLSSRLIKLISENHIVLTACLDEFQVYNWKASNILLCLFCISLSLINIMQNELFLLVYLLN